MKGKRKLKALYTIDLSKKEQYRLDNNLYKIDDE